MGNKAGLLKEKGVAFPNSVNGQGKISPMGW